MREGDGLDVDSAAQSLTPAQFAFQQGEFVVVIHIDMAADMAGAVGDQVHGKAHRLAMQIKAQRETRVAFIVDQGLQLAALAACKPAHAPSGFIQMGVGIDPCRNGNRAIAVFNRHAIRRKVQANGGTATIADQQVSFGSSHRANIVDQKISHSLPQFSVQSSAQSVTQQVDRHDEQAKLQHGEQHDPPHARKQELGATPDQRAKAGPAPRSGGDGQTWGRRGV